MNKKLLLYIYTAMFTALACIATMIIKVPTIGTNGYVNIGDSIVLVSAWLLGNPFGAIAAGLGSGLADIFSGYAVYAPGTMVIKFLMAFVGCIVYKVLDKIKITKIVSYIVSAIVSEIIMIVGYLTYESLFLGYGKTAVLSVPSNAIQGITCLVIGVVLILAIKKVPYINGLFGGNN